MPIPEMIVAAVIQDPLHSKRLEYLREVQVLAKRFNQPVPEDVRRVLEEPISIGTETLYGKTVSVIDAEFKNEEKTLTVCIPIDKIPQHGRATHLVIWVNKTPQ